MRTHEHLASTKQLHEGNNMVTKSPHISRSFHVITFEEFANKESDELEQEFQDFLKLGNFSDAAKALLGAAIQADSESMDYVLKIDINALTYYTRKDLQNTQIVITKIAQKLQQ